MRVLCSLPNASANINGVAFETHPGGMISESIGDDLASQFAAIPGFSLIEEAAIELSEPIGESVASQFAAIPGHSLIEEAVVEVVDAVSAKVEPALPEPDTVEAAVSEPADKVSLDTQVQPEKHKRKG